MAKRASVEERVLGYFETAPIELAQLMFALVKGRMKARTKPASPAVVTRKKRTKVGKAMGAATSFVPAELVGVAHS